MNHIGDTNKMVGEDHIRDATKMVSDTPRTTDRVVFIDGNPWVNAPFARGLERELNAANERIKCLIEERDRANRLADWKWNLRGEFESLLGTYNIEEGIKLVKEMKRRIKRLEDIINRAHLAFFSDSSDRKVSIAMHRILDEEVRKEVKP